MEGRLRAPVRRRKLGERVGRTRFGRPSRRSWSVTRVTRRQLSRPVLTRDRSWADLDAEARFTRAFFDQPVLEVARELLGACLISTIGGQTCAGVVVEVEAYGGPEDPASHAATRSGLTERNRAMFGPSGRAYVYRSYGMHWCMNVVTGPEGQGLAVLLRSIDPLVGESVMLSRRGRYPLGSGPGRLSQALGITDALYGHDVSKPPLRLVPGWSVPDSDVETSGRVGIKSAAEWPHRFYVRGASGVSGLRRRSSRSASRP